MIDLPPDVPPQYAPVVIAQASQAQQGDTKIERTIGVCRLIQNLPIPSTTAINAFSPLRSANVYFSRVERREVGLDGNAVVLQGPEHGVLEDAGNGVYRYHPTPDYYGQDRATFQVEIGGLKVKVLYFFKVQSGGFGGTEGYDPYEDKRNCPNGHYWRISRNTN